MAQEKATSAKQKRPKNIFISWSGENSKEIANELKKTLETTIFAASGLHCFVSNIDIISGEDWWSKIKKELKACQMGILCITKENIKAPWIYFEAGALVARDVPVIPLLISCNVNALEHSPIKGNQCINFYDHKQFLKMIYDINNRMGLLALEKHQLDPITREAYDALKRDLEPILFKLKNLRLFNAKFVYPSKITAVKLNTVFVSAPMASVDENEYHELREALFSLQNILFEIGFVEVVCPMLAVEDKTAFDGKAKAIKTNFPKMKEADSLLVVYPYYRASSALVEIGYGLALSKRTVIFYREQLPFILEAAGETISHIKVHKFTEYNDIVSIVKSEGMDVFEGDQDE